MPRVPVVDGFRAFAILGVVSLHLLLLAGMEQGTRLSLIGWGLFGNVIDTFFIITGFVLFLGVVTRGGEPRPAADFALGRAARLLPAYWLSLVVLLFLIALAPDAPPFPPSVPFPGLGETLANFSTLQMPVRLFDTAMPIGFAINGPLWMISIIAGFYVCFPLIARGYYRHPLLGLAIALAITIAWKQAVIHVPGLFEWLDQSESPLWVIQFAAIDQLPGWGFSFALGMTGAWAYVRAAEGGSLDRFKRPALYFGAAAVIAYGVCAYLYADRAHAAGFGTIGGSYARTSAPTLHIAYTFARAALLAAVILGPLWLRKPFDNPAVRKVAEVSFGIYLIHLVVCAYLGMVLLDLPQDGTPLAFALWFGTVIPVSAAYAWLSLRYVEAPARRWARRTADESSRARSGTQTRRAEPTARPSPGNPA